MTDTPTLSAIERLINRPRRTATHRIYLDPNRADAITEARQARDIARLMARGESPGEPAVRTLRDAEEAFAEVTADADVVTFTLRAVGAEVVDSLIVEHQPTKAQKDRARRLDQPAPSFDEDEVYCRLLAESISTVLMEGSDEAAIDGLTLDQMREMWRSKSWPRDDLVELAEKALALNKTGTSAGALGNA